MAEKRRRKLEAGAAAAEKVEVDDMDDMAETRPEKKGRSNETDAAAAEQGGGDPGQGAFVFQAGAARPDRPAKKKGTKAQKQQVSPRRTSRRTGKGRPSTSRTAAGAEEDDAEWEEENVGKATNRKAKARKVDGKAKRAAAVEARRTKGPRGVKAALTFYKEETDRGSEKAGVAKEARGVLKQQWKLLSVGEKKVRYHTLHTHAPTHTHTHAVHTHTHTHI